MADHPLLAKAHSSSLRLEKRGGKTMMRKSVDASERKNEIAFHRLLIELHLPAFSITEDDQDLLIDFLDGAQTLDDAPTEVAYQQLGAWMRQVHSKQYEQPFWVDGEGENHPVAWSNFVRSRIEKGITRQQERNGFTPVQASQIAAAIGNLPAPPAVVPLHGDLHGNNVLFADQRLFVFDKADHIFAGDPLYDLSLFAILLPGILDLGSTVAQDKRFFETLQMGYGKRIIADESLFLRYVLLRCLERFPNPFDQAIPVIVAKFL